ncbi:bacillithiol biosynthesis cysteine-adding enzyme BshC [Alkalihalobacillus sp. MEB130]|uniref:bacillithiol biosynthesis cysteine-adding enzyme BshC n=1 Tax=Alkalihalobacillus sp. MEB130 TaxID=2976704 RepID=UPI0028DED261|nr:bacillithiol biosynthesis cysteine-adding enzyme BshC [Alkalihalobacillus sp. MEB130]MDT8859130.1 bacillithiol biosynthesis cysteine-adding enzyme BshC [Alkalihalobacillus sp. MEB130]
MLGQWLIVCYDEKELSDTKGRLYMMEVREIDLISNTGFMRDYISGHERMESFFDFTYNDVEKFSKRADDLLSRTFKRKELADYLLDVHTSLEGKEQTLIQIEKLRQPNSVVVVGGQQAGLLTGPLYTVYKAISIVLLAKQQEEKLKIPVVPVFWIAGEDHDVDEIRFVYKEKAGNWKKHLYNDHFEVASASMLHLNKKELQRWTDELFATLPETVHTKSILGQLRAFMDQSTTFVDFFKEIMNWLFGSEGLLLLDAHDPVIRNLETDYFEALIQDVEQVQIRQQHGAAAFAKAGYGDPIVTDETNAHLFLEINGERKRLDYEENGFFVKDTDISFTKSELLTLLHKEPERFSNNVVTRPLMQEWLLPVLAFVAGPGELRYWATLKQVFSHFHLNVPPVIPRIQMTFIPPDVQKWLAETKYDLKPFLLGKMTELRESWLEDATVYPIDEVIEQVKAAFSNHHQPLQELASKMDPTLAKMSEKNFAIMENQIEFMNKKMKLFVRQSHEHTLAKFTEAGKWAAPLNLPQERVFHPILLMNVIGEDGFRRLLSTDMSVTPTHKIVYL